MLAILQPYPAELMEAWPVSDRVNSEKADGADLLLPVKTVPAGGAGVVRQRGVRAWLNPSATDPTVASRSRPESSPRPTPPFTMPALRVNREPAA